MTLMDRPDSVLPDGERVCVCGHRKSNHSIEYEPPGRAGHCVRTDCKCRDFVERVSPTDREAMETACRNLYPPPHNLSHVDTIDVARWDAFAAGWAAHAKADMSHGQLRQAAQQMLVAANGRLTFAPPDAVDRWQRFSEARESLAAALAASPPTDGDTGR